MNIIIVGTKISLLGKTKKGKERVKQYGAGNWIVKRVEDSVLFSSEKGPWLLIDNGNTNACRWIHGTWDKNYEIKICA